MLQRKATPLLAVVSAMASLASLALVGCSSGRDQSSGSGSLFVVTTVAPITSIAANIGGDKVSITGLVPEGTNSHTFEPPPSASVDLSQADIVLINGLGLEEPTKELAEETMSDDATLVEIGTTVLPESDYIYDFSFPEDGGKPNPHLWTDPTWAVKYAALIRDTFSEADPDNATYYEQNFEVFQDEATALSNALRADQETIPGPRALLTYHDAYAYFADTFGWTVIGAIQPKNFEDPSPKEVAQLIDQIRAQDVPTIFGSEVFPSKALEQIAAETGVRYEDTLRDDDLPGGPGDSEHSWLGLMRYDYVTMITGLGGAAPTLTALDVRDVTRDRSDYPQ